MALSKLHLCVKVWEAWTDFGSVGVVRRAGVGKSDKFSEAFSQVAQVAQMSKKSKVESITLHTCPRATYTHVSPRLVTCMWR